MIGQSSTFPFALAWSVLNNEVPGTHTEARLQFAETSCEIPRREPCAGNKVDSPATRLSHLFLGSFLGTVRELREKIPSLALRCTPTPCVGFT